MKMSQHLRIILAISVIFLFSSSALFDGGPGYYKELNKNGEKKTHISESIGDNEQQFIPGPVSYIGNIGFPETVEQIMERDKMLPPPDGKIHDNGLEERLPYPDRHNLQQNPDAKEESSYPPLTSEQKQHQQNTTDNPQTVSTSFTAITVFSEL